MSRLRTPDYLAGLAGLALLVSLFAPWYELSDGTADGWRSLGFIDLWLLITAFLAMSIPVITATRDEPALPVAMDVLTWWASIVAAILVVYRLLSEANAEVVTGRAWGIFFAAASVVACFAAAHWAMRKQDAPGLKPPPEIRAMPTPPVRDPATPPT